MKLEKKKSEEKHYLKFGKFMSRLGKKPIEVAGGVTVELNGSTLSVTGPKGNLKREIPSEVLVSVNGSEVTVSLKNPESVDPIWGTISSHVMNMIEGVSKGFEKKLQIEGIGYKGEVKGKEVVMSLGFSHPVNITIPEGLAVTIEKSTITVSGIDKEAVGAFAAKVRDYKKPEPYKGKGIRYVGEHVTIKQGKKSV